MALVPITTVAQYTAADAACPEDGDDLLSDDIRDALQIALDRAHYARGGLWGQLLWSGRFTVDPGGSSTVFAVKVGAISSLCVKDATGVWRPYYVAAETTLTLADVESAPANLSNSTWYYVYAYSDGTSTLRFLINTTAPAADLLWQSAGGDGLRRYLGCFRTNGSGAPIALRAHRGRYIWRMSSVSGALVVNSYTAAAGFADLALTSYMPPHARIALLRATIINTSITTEHSIAVRVRTKGDTAAYDEVAAGPATTDTASGNASRAHSDFEIETDSSNVVQVEISGSSSSFSASVYARGFQE